ncbi:YggT family protein [Propionimicrobium lymphophilum]|uniref:YggT family protein n=1 Tax=Propionimicrobium lymphophilum TaxID=33012 RepID=UPI0004020CB6|nr:YggT family protein [Propionimicrobium lymphophilum]
MVVIGLAIYWVLRIYLWALIGRMVISWVPLFAPDWRPGKLLASLFEIVYTLTDPPLKFLNRYIKPLPLGTVSLDLGFMVLFVIVLFAQRLTLFIFF